MNVTISNNTVTLAATGKQVSFNGSEMDNVTFTVDRQRQTIGALTPAPLADGANTAPGYVAPTPKYIIVMTFKDDVRSPERFYLADVDNQAGWTDNLAGAQQAVTDIKATMTLTAGGGGPPTGAAGGVLSGTYPDPGLATSVAIPGSPTTTTQAPGDNSTKVATTAFTTAAITAAVVGLWDDRGNYDASVNTFPAAGGSGSAGAILKGDIWTISVAGTLGVVPVAARQTVRAMQDTPGQTAGNWAIGLANTDIDDSITDGITGRAPSQNAVFDALVLKAPLASPALTVTPTAPTAAPGTNTTQIATTAFVQAAANAKVTDAIVDGVTTVAPSQNAVFDALALKLTANGVSIDALANMTGVNDFTMVGGEYKPIRQINDTETVADNDWTVWCNDADPTIVLPGTPVHGRVINVKFLGPGTMTIDRNSIKIENANFNITSTSPQSRTFQYDNVPGSWFIL